MGWNHNHRIAKVGEEPQDHPVQPFAHHQWFSLNHVPQRNIQTFLEQMVDVGGMAVEVEPSCQNSVTFCCCATDDSRRAI